MVDSVMLEKVFSLAKVGGDTFGLPVDVVLDYRKNQMGVCLCIDKGSGNSAVVVMATVHKKVKVTLYFVGKNFNPTWKVKYEKAVSPDFWRKIKMIVDSFFL